MDSRLAIGKDGVTELRSLGYTIFPAPQQVKLTKTTIILNHSWQIIADMEGGEKALKSLQTRAKSIHDLVFDGTGAGKIILRIIPNLINGINNHNTAKQAYKITLETEKVTIEGNTEAGLFYGVQSLLQLLKAKGGGTFQLPVGTITDWPDLELRFIHWDTKHHQDHLETLQRYIDEAAYFKVNAIAFEIEDKYEYPSHPVIGAPGAFTKAEMQALTKYALDRFIQLVPTVQAPAHMGFVLKHEKFAHLRADGNNYQACMCDEEALELIFDMYQDLIDATPGVDYFFVSTDEVYYAGICDKCKNEYNEVNRSQQWVDYVNRVHRWMSNHGRQMLTWIEYPLLIQDILKLPSGLIDGITDTYRSEEWLALEHKAGIQQLAYTSIQGEEYLFPNYFAANYRNQLIAGILRDIPLNVINVETKGADLKGTFAAAWDDAGLHNETFWLGWATVTQYGWSKNTPTLEQNIADFMDVFYGADSPEMIEMYVMLEEGARFYEDMWDKEISTERAQGYGNSEGKDIGGKRYDQVLHLPALPSAQDLSITSQFRNRYAQKIEKAASLSRENDQLIHQLMHIITRVRRNGYNLEVFLSIAFLERFAINTLLNLAKTEDYLVEAATTGGDYAKGMELLIKAHTLAGDILKEKNTMWADFTVTWEKSRFKEGQTVNKKAFMQVPDDVKDHFADRRIGLEYMLAPFQRMELEVWKKQLGHIIIDFAKAHNIPITGFEVKRLED